MGFCQAHPGLQGASTPAPARESLPSPLFRREASPGPVPAAPALAETRVLRKGQRLSIQPVEKKYFQRVYKMAGAKTPMV